MADEVLTITNFFHFGPPNNTREYYDKRAQEYVDKYAKGEERNVKLIAKFYPVRDPARPDEPDAMIADVEFNGTFTAPTSSETQKVPNQVIDQSADVKQQAEQKAAESGVAATVTATDNKGNETTITAQPPKRPADLLDKAQGKTKPTDPPPDPDSRTLAAAAGNAKSTTGSASTGDELDNSPSPAQPKDQLVKVFNGAPRQLGGVIPTLEGIMMNIPQASLGKFTSLLPPAFRSLLPLGAIAGLVSKGPVQLGGLTNLMAGAALGVVAGQALRSLTGGPSAVSGLTGALGAQAVARVSGSRAVPVNIASTFGNALLSNAAGNVAGTVARNALGTSAATAGVIANVVGVVTNVALNKNSGIPVNSQVLGLAANVALRAAGVPTSVPTRVLGLASSSAMNPIAAMIGSSVSGRIPVLPGNLSLPNVGALSGLSQNIGPGLAETIIPPNQLLGLLPGNLQAQIPGVPPRVSGRSPYVQNSVGSRRAAAQDSSGPVETNPNATTKDAMVKGTGGADVDYSLKISEHYTLGDFCITPAVTPRRKIRAWEAGGLSVDQIVENLSWLAVNLMEPIRAQFPGFTINGGYDYPGAEVGSKRAGKSRHFYGSAIDLQWRGDMRDFQANKNRAIWIANNLPIRACILEAAGKGIWIHVDGRKEKEAKYIATHSYWKEISRGSYVDPL